MASLGDRIRELRTNRNQTLKQVSAETGLSVSFLSLVERDRVSISVDNLERLARYFSVRLVHLFQGVEDSAVQITRGLPLQEKLKKRITTEPGFALLARRTGARMEPLLVQIDPGNGDGEFRVHEGDVLLYVLEGKIRLISEKGDVDELQPGDSAYYYGFPGRRIENASLEEPAQILLVSSPPTYLRDEALDGRRGLLIPAEI
jgi:transcriptional regulator with XRE-family HTH domain